MSEYKLYYFNGKGRAELSRYIFAVANQKYEDVRYEREQWPEHKSEAPFGQVPWLEVVENGEKMAIAQSLAIARHLARKFNLYGKTDNQKTEIDMYADLISDLINAMVAVYFEKDETKKKQLEEELANQKLPGYMTHFEKKLIKSGTGYLIGDSLTWVDLYLFNVLEWLRDKKDAVLAHFSQIKAFDEKISNLPQIKEWIAKRPVTEM